jgi:phage baseplate assembly protein W
MNPAWQILPDPITADVVGVSIARAETGRSITSGTLGRGLIRPFRRAKDGDFASATGVELVQSAVGLVLGTTCGSEVTQGELPWRTEFGTLLQQLRLRANSPALAELARNRVATALARWVPSVRVRTVTVTRAIDTLSLRIVYDIVDPSGSKTVVHGLETSVALG